MVRPGEVVAIANTHLSSDDYGPEAVRDGAPLAAVLDDAEEGPFADNAAFLLTYEALTSLQVAVHKLAAECQQRVISFASRDFADATAVGVTRAIETLPTVKEWVAKLQTRIEKRGPMPLVDTGLPPRFVRTCDVYELSPVDRKLVGALLMMRTTHAFNSVKMSSSMGYGGGSSLYGNNSKAAVTLAGILGVHGADEDGDFAAVGERGADEFAEFAACGVIVHAVVELAWAGGGVAVVGDERDLGGDGGEDIGLGVGGHDGDGDAFGVGFVEDVFDDGVLGGDLLAVGHLEVDGDSEFGLGFEATGAGFVPE
jgi:hypothetical protein